MSLSFTQTVFSFALVAVLPCIFHSQGTQNRKVRFHYSTLTPMSREFVTQPAHFSRSAATKMDPNFLLIAVGFVLTVTAWKKWFRERVLLPRVRNAIFLSGLCATSVALIEYSVFILYVHRIGGFGNNLGPMLLWARPGFFLSVTALAFAMTGRGRSRILVVAASSELLAIWVILVSSM